VVPLYFKEAMEKNLETSLLQVLIALSHKESVSGAAQELNVTQSAVSQSLKSLENKVGFTILNRAGKQVALTEEGRKLAKVAKASLKRIEETIESIHSEHDLLKGQVHIGTLAGIGKSWISAAMIDFLAKYPEIELKMSLDFPENLIKRFERGEIDAIILPENVLPPWPEKWVLHEERITLIFPKKWAITNKTELKDIIQYPLIMFESHDPLFYRWVRERFKVTPRNIKEKLVVNSFGQILRAVEKGLGIAVVPTHVLDRFVVKDKLGQLTEAGQIFNHHIVFACHPEDSKNVKIQTLFEFLRHRREEKN
jgi:DNA-binding transcriptional LysR family regulator